MTDDRRTLRQNAALHKYLTLVADALNDGGYSVQLVLKQDVAVDWTPTLVKEILWRSVQKAILKKSSTTELSKQKDIDVVFEHLNRHLGERFGIHVPFPTSEPEMRA